MLGPIITFLVVCAIVAIYMSVVHSFLRASEEADAHTPEGSRIEPEAERRPSVAGRWRKRWAH